MSKRRMFSQTIIEHDTFLDMPLSSQMLYVHLCMNADDYGFVSPKRVLRMVGANDDDLKILLAKRYVLGFESGVVVIKHWQINNTIRKDRSQKTTYEKEMKLLTKNEFGAYTEISKITTTVQELTEVVNHSATIGQPNAGILATQKRLEEIRLEEKRESKDSYVNPAEPVSRPGKITTKEFFGKLVTELGFSDKVLATDGRIRKLKIRLKTFSPADMLAAAKNLGGDAYMQGSNDSGKRYGTIDYFLRSDEIVDKYLNEGNQMINEAIDEKKYV